MLDGLTDKKERIERELAQYCETYRKETARLRSRFTDLAQALPEGVAVVDFVRYLDWSDPKSAAPGNQPTARFTAFVLRRDASRDTAWPVWNSAPSADRPRRRNLAHLDPGWEPWCGSCAVRTGPR